MTWYTITPQKRGTEMTLLSSLCKTDGTLFPCVCVHDEDSFSVRLAVGKQEDGAKEARDVKERKKEGDESKGGGGRRKKKDIVFVYVYNMQATGAQITAQREKKKMWKSNQDLFHPHYKKMKKNTSR